MYVCIFICCTVWYKMIREHIDKENIITVNKYNRTDRTECDVQQLSFL